MSPEIIAALIGAVGAIVIALLGQYGAKQLGIGVDQQNLVNILKMTVDAQKNQIEDLQTRDEIKSGKIDALEKNVSELKDLTVSQAKTIDALNRTIEGIKQTGRRRVRATPAETQN